MYNELGSPSELVKQEEVSMDESKDDNIDDVTKTTNKFIPEKNARYKGAVGALCSKDPLHFQVVNLRYDLTPIENISAVATEHGLIPPTSIPVLVEELRTEE